MAQSFDLILRGGTVVNHDGEGLGDVAVTAGRVAAIGDLRRPPPPRPSTAAACMCCPA
jgi:dihydroorotase